MKMKHLRIPSVRSVCFLKEVLTTTKKHFSKYLFVERDFDIDLGLCLTNKHFQEILRILLQKQVFVSLGCILLGFYLGFYCIILKINFSHIEF